MKQINELRGISMSCNHVSLFLFLCYWFSAHPLYRNRLYLLFSCIDRLYMLNQVQILLFAVCNNSSLYRQSCSPFLYVDIGNIEVTRQKRPIAKETISFLSLSPNASSVVLCRKASGNIPWCLYLCCCDCGDVVG